MVGCTLADSLVLLYSGVFELNFMSNQPVSGYYQFTVAVTGDSRLVANHVEVSLRTVVVHDSDSYRWSQIEVEVGTYWPFLQQLLLT